MGSKPIPHLSKVKGSMVRTFETRRGRTTAIVGTLVLGLLFLFAINATTAHAENIGFSGDISPEPSATTRFDFQTASLLSSSANGIGLVLTGGDLQYEDGALDKFMSPNAFDGSWGRWMSMLRPCMGNHEYLQYEVPSTALLSATTKLQARQAAEAGYYTYFQTKVPPHPGYYAFSWQGWRFVCINTTFGVLTETEKAQQLAWFKHELATDNSRCQVIIGHHPYKATKSPYPGEPELAKYWPSMVLDDVELYLAGHNHSYERSAEFRTAGNVDSDFGPGDGDDGHAGVRQVVAGMGGKSRIGFSGTPTISSRYRYAGNYGVLKIVPDYPTPGKWVQAFKTINGQTIDRVTGTCRP